MDTEIKDNKFQRLKLTSSDEIYLIGLVNNAWEKGQDARQKYKDDWEATNRAYLCEHDWELNEGEQWRTRNYFPWANEAVENVYSYLSAALLPKGEDFFQLVGRSKEDEAILEPFQKFLKYLLEEKSNYKQVLRSRLRAMLRFNHDVCKKHWRKEYKEYPDRDLESGEITIKRELVYNAPFFEPLRLKDVSVHPIKLPLSERISVHQTRRQAEEIIEAAESERINYINIDKVKDWAETARLNKNNDGMCVKEASIPRFVLDGKVYTNYMVTIAENILIRCQPMPAYYEGCTFDITPMIPDVGSVYGYGLLSKAIGILKYANHLANSRGDGIKIGIYSEYKYWDDGIFSAESVVSRPGAMHEFADANSVQTNMLPVQKDLSGLQITAEEIAFYKAEFEEATITKSMKGMIESGDATATEVTYAYNSHTNSLAVIAQYLNETIVKKDIKDVIRMVRYQLMIDPDLQDLFVQVTGEPLQGLPSPEIDVKVVGYDNYIQKQQTAMSLNSLIGVTKDTPWAIYLKGYNLLKRGLQALSIYDEDVVVTSDEAEQIDQRQAERAQQEQQAQMMMAQAQLQQQQQLIEIEKMKQDTQLQIKQMELQADLQKHQAKLENDAEIAVLKAQIEAAKIEADTGFRVASQELEYQKIQGAVTSEPSRQNEAA